MTQGSPGLWVLEGLNRSNLSLDLWCRRPNTTTTTPTSPKRVVFTYLGHEMQAELSPMYFSKPVFFTGGDL